MTGLAGRRVVVTRPGPGADELAAALRDRGATAVVVPVMARRRLADDAAIATGLAAHAGSDAIVVFTSRHAVALVAQAARRGAPGLAACAATVVAIGPGTADQLARAGRHPDLVPSVFIAEAVADALVARGVAGRPIWLPRAIEGRSVLPERLRAAGARVTELSLYRTVTRWQMAAPLARALAGPLDAVTFTSGSTVRHFERLRGGRPLPVGCQLVCIGPVTAQAVRAAGLPVAIIAAEHSIDGLLRTLGAAFGAGAAPSQVAAGGPP